MRTEASAPASTSVAATSNAPAAAAACKADYAYYGTTLAEIYSLYDNFYIKGMLDTWNPLDGAWIWLADDEAWEFANDPEFVQAVSSLVAHEAALRSHQDAEAPIGPELARDGVTQGGALGEDAFPRLAEACRDARERQRRRGDAPLCSESGDDLCAALTTLSVR